MEYRRNFQSGGTFFFTVVTYRRQHLFVDDTALRLLREVVREVKSERKFRMDAWVVMPDHLHMLWTLPPDDADFSGRWSKIKSLFTRRWLASGGKDSQVTVGKQRERRRGVWQPKFFEHTIRDEDDYIAHVEYIHYNPVKHGHVAYPKQWQHSSFAEYVRRGWHPIDWCCGTTAQENHPQTSLSYEGFE